MVKRSMISFDICDFCKKVLQAPGRPLSVAQPHRLNQATARINFADEMANLGKPDYPFLKCGLWKDFRKVMALQSKDEWVESVRLPSEQYKARKEINITKNPLVRGTTKYVFSNANDPSDEQVLDKENLEEEEED